MKKQYKKLIELDDQISKQLKTADGRRFYWKNLTEESEKFDLIDLIFVFTVSMLSAYFCLILLFKFITQIGLLPFVIYRIVLGCLIYIFLV